MKLPNSYIKYV